MKKQGFTLTELLVALAIVALLVALSLPSLQKALQAGRAARCASNLHQIGAAALMWSADNNQRIVPVYMPGAPSSWGALAAWTGLLAPYLGRTSTNAFVSPQEMPVYMCPEAPGRFGYGYNYYYLSWIFPSGGINQWVTYMQVRNASKTVMLVDNWNPHNPAKVPSAWQNFVRPPMSQSMQDGVPDFRHPGKTANVLWVDGHVSAEKADPLDKDTSSNALWDKNQN